MPKTSFSTWLFWIVAAIALVAALALLKAEIGTGGHPHYAEWLLPRPG